MISPLVHHQNFVAVADGRKPVVQSRRKCGLSSVRPRLPATARSLSLSSDEVASSKIRMAGRAKWPVLWPRVGAARREFGAAFAHQGFIPRGKLLG